MTKVSRIFLPTWLKRKKYPHSISAKENIALLTKVADLSNLCTAKPAAALHTTRTRVTIALSRFLKKMG